MPFIFIAPACADQGVEKNVFRRLDYQFSGGAVPDMMNKKDRRGLGRFFATAAAVVGLVGTQVAVAPARRLRRCQQIPPIRWR